MLVTSLKQQNSPLHESLNFITQYTNFCDEYSTELSARCTSIHSFTLYLSLRRSQCQQLLLIRVISSYIDISFLCLFTFLYAFTLLGKLVTNFLISFLLSVHMNNHSSLEIEVWFFSISQTMYEKKPILFPCEKIKLFFSVTFFINL